MHKKQITTTNYPHTHTYKLYYKKKSNTQSNTDAEQKAWFRGHLHHPDEKLSTLKRKFHVRRFSDRLKTCGHCLSNRTWWHWKWQAKTKALQSTDDRERERCNVPANDGRFWRDVRCNDWNQASCSSVLVHNITSSWTYQHSHLALWSRDHEVFVIFTNLKYQQNCVHSNPKTN